MTNENRETGFMHPALPRITPQRSIVKSLFWHVYISKQDQYAVVKTAFTTPKDGLRHGERRPFAMQKAVFCISNNNRADVIFTITRWHTSHYAKRRKTPMFQPKAGLMHAAGRHNASNERDMQNPTAVLHIPSMCQAMSIFNETAW